MSYKTIDELSSEFFSKNKDFVEMKTYQVKYCYKEETNTVLFTLINCCCPFNCLTGLGKHIHIESVND
jgi:hypothetical protein